MSNYVVFTISQNQCCQHGKIPCGRPSCASLPQSTATVLINALLQLEKKQWPPQLSLANCFAMVLATNRRMMSPTTFSPHASVALCHCRPPSHANVVDHFTGGHQRLGNNLADLHDQRSPKPGRNTATWQNHPLSQLAELRGGTRAAASCMATWRKMTATVPQLGFAQVDLHAGILIQCLFQGVRRDVRGKQKKS